MKKPIPLRPEFVSTALAMELIRQGRDSITLTFDDYQSNGLADAQLQCTGEFESEDADIPTSFTLTIVRH